MSTDAEPVAMVTDVARKQHASPGKLSASKSGSKKSAGTSLVKVPESQDPAMAVDEPSPVATESPSNVLARMSADQSSLMSLATTDSLDSAIEHPVLFLDIDHPATGAGTDFDPACTHPVLLAPVKSDALMLADLAFSESVGGIEDFFRNISPPSASDSTVSPMTSEDALAQAQVRQKQILDKLAMAEARLNQQRLDILMGKVAASNDSVPPPAWLLDCESSIEAASDPALKQFIQSTLHDLDADPDATDMSSCESDDEAIAPVLLARYVSHS